MARDFEGDLRGSSTAVHSPGEIIWCGLQIRDKLVVDCQKLAEFICTYGAASNWSSYRDACATSDKEKDNLNLYNLEVAERYRDGTIITTALTTARGHS